MDDNPNSGHRSRLLDRFAEHGVTALSDHEIIELLLTYVHAQCDTKPIAKDLLKTFKTISGVINAPSKQLRTIKGIGPKAAALFPLIKELMSLCLQEKYRQQPLITHRKDVLEHLRFHFGLMRDEYVAALFLDNANRVLNTEIVAEGTVNQCAVYPRKVIELALKYGAASIILAHNHPGGSTTPSEADWTVTRNLFEIGKLMEIPLHDHIIIARENALSLREMSRWPAQK